MVSSPLFFTARGDPEAQEALKKLPERKAELEEQYPEALVEAWSVDEHRLELKPIIRKL